MKKFIILLFTVFLLSGCSVEYNLNIDEKINENIQVGKFDASEIEEFEYLTPYAIVNELIQEFYIFDYSNQTLNLSYNYNKDTYGMSEAFNNCYDISNFSYDDKHYYIKTSGKFNCLSYLNYNTDEIKINIKSNYKVVESNADYNEDNIYTWVINKQNSSDKPINIVFDITEKEIDNKSNILSQFSTFFLIVGVLVVISIIIFIVYLFNKKNNKI